MLPKFRTPYNYEFKKHDRYEAENDLPSETIPDMSISVKEIIIKYASGTIGNLQKHGNYDLEGSEVNPDEFIDETMSPDFDLSDAAALRTSLEVRAAEREKNKETQAKADSASGSDMKETEDNASKV